MRNRVVEEMNFLMHYGVGHEDGGNSGRYPWGSGKTPYQTSGDFLSRLDKLREIKDISFVDPKTGKTYYGEAAVARTMGMTTTEMRVRESLAKEERRMILSARAQELYDKGYSRTKIAKMMGYKNESSIRSLLNESSALRMQRARNTAAQLKMLVDEKGMIDVGVGVERELGVTAETLKKALYILKAEGYPNYGGRIPQVTNPTRMTTLSVLCPPGTEHKDIYDYKNIHTVTEYHSTDGGKTFNTFHYPESLDSNRISIRYAEEGGLDRDGLIEIRPGVKDLDLNGSRYCQVRILVDGTHYLKGMAVYSTDIPEGKDVVFNTNKSVGTPATKVFKEIKNDPKNPFGSAISPHGQHYYEDENGKQKLSLINKRADEGEWGEWADKLPSQFLSKQKLKLAERQLDLAASDKEAEFKEISELNNPTIKRKLLEDFASDCDSAAVHLYAAALPRQKYHVILPVPSMKDTEVYAPKYENGEQVILVRYPHEGTFQIPVLKVNNRNKDARKMLGSNPSDGIAINSKVAEKLSGADFDGDTVMVIPTKGLDITATPTPDDLKDFDPKAEYPYHEGIKLLSEQAKGKEMGVVSNLITDMTLQGAPIDELARATRYSMTVIDAAKHHLDYKQSEIDNGIKELKRKYQGHFDENGNYREGASTIISRAKSEVSVVKRKGSPTIDKETGALIWKTDPQATYVDKNGVTRTRTQRSTKMMEAKDAYELVSDADNFIERAYAEYANRMKNLANQARLEIVQTPRLEYSPQARRDYDEQVKRLDAALDLAKRNAPRERAAQIIANTMIDAYKEDYPEMPKSELKKKSQQALVQAREDVGAARTPIVIDDDEWEAIQAGAISDTKLMDILNNADIDKLRQRATPRATTELSEYKQQKIQSMAAFGATQAEIASALGISVSTVNKYINSRGNQYA